MNHTVIDSRKLAKIKKLNRQIQSLRELRQIFGEINGLTPRQKMKLELKENKLTKIINTL
jgi:hypothetical protein